MSIAAKTELTLPQQLFAGIAYDITDKLLIEFSLRWEDWTAFDQLEIIPDGFPTEVQVRDWHDTWAYSLGGEYKLDQETTLLAGYLFTENAVPDATFEPAIPDSDSHLFCIGLNYQWDRYDFSASYGFQHQQGRNKITVPADGEYESDLHLVGFSLGYRF
jgi:long-chain fatty acid transport protein